jgi:hypothetical protein
VTGLRLSQLSHDGQIDLEQVAVGLIGQDESKVGEHGHPVALLFAPRQAYPLVGMANR